VGLITRWGERRWRDARPAGSEAAELQELRALAALARTTQLIGAREESIIVNAAKLSTRPVRESMLRAEYIGMLDMRSSLADALVRCHLDLHTRFPVTEEADNPQRIVGYVNFKDVVACMRLGGSPSLRSILRPIPSFHEDMALSGCLEQLIREHTHIALIVGREGKIAGMITLEDIIEELVGEIQDEYDRLPAHIKQSGNGWVAGGGVSLTRLADLAGVNLTTDPSAPAARTLSDWMVARLGRSVQGGDVVRHGDISVIVRSVRRNQLREAQINRFIGEGADPCRSGPGLP
jgi:putative hemolysin